MKKHESDFEGYLNDLYAHNLKRYPQKKRGAFNWIKREIFFAEEMSNKEFFQMLLMCVFLVPVVIVVVIMIFAGGFALQGMLP